MNLRKVISDTAFAFTAQAISMFLSFIQSLLIPKVLGIEEYSYWQLFLFYCSYIGFFHLGMNDGVYLQVGGTPRERIDKREINSLLFLSTTYQTVFALICICLVCINSIELPRKVVILSVSFYMVVQNASSYLMYLMQAMNETKRSSLATMINRLVYLVPLLTLLITRAQSFILYILSYLISAIIQLSFCLYCCSDILVAGTYRLHTVLEDAKECIITGSKLMVANLASQLILGVLRASIDYSWGIQEFGKLSLSITLVNFFLSFVSQAAMVLFPALRQCQDSEIRSFYKLTKDMLGVLFPAVFLLYFPIIAALKVWLPQYASGIWIFAWLLPICVFDSKMNITCTTLFKVRHEVKTLLLINLLALTLCAAGVGVSVFHYQSFILAVACTTGAIVIRSLLAEIVIERELSLHIDYLSLSELVLTAIFIYVESTFGNLTAAVLYGLAYAVFLMMNFKRVLTACRSVRNQVAREKLSEED